MSVLGIVLPTVDGREDVFRRAYASLADERPFRLGLSLHVQVERGHATCGAAWEAGAAKLARRYGHALEWLMFSADDLIAHEGWLAAALERVDEGEVPGAFLYGLDGERQQSLDGPADSLFSFPRVPFFPASAWRAFRPVPPLHYFSDVWVGDELAGLGYKVRGHAGYAFTHEWAGPGRIHDDGPDRRLYERLRSGA